MVKPSASKKKSPAEKTKSPAFWVHPQGFRTVHPGLLRKVFRYEERISPETGAQKNTRPAKVGWIFLGETRQTRHPLFGRKLCEMTMISVDFRPRAGDFLADDVCGYMTMDWWRFPHARTISFRMYRRVQTNYVCLWHLIWDPGWKIDRRFKLVQKVSTTWRCPELLGMNYHKWPPAWLTVGVKQLGPQNLHVV